MIDRRVFDREQSEAFLEVFCLGDNTNQKTICSDITESQSWRTEVFLISFFVGIVIEAKKKKGQDVSKLFESLYLLPEQMYLNILELDTCFIEFMLLHLMPDCDCFESDLVILYESMVNYDYTKTLRL